MDGTRRSFLKAAVTAAGAAATLRACAGPKCRPGPRQRAPGRPFRSRIASQVARIAPRGKGAGRPGGARCTGRHDGTQGGSAQRSPRGGESLGRPRLQEALAPDAPAAIAELGYASGQGEHMLVVENTPEVHNLIVCTLCSCYPWPVLGLPPVWYKSAPYRSRAVIDPRGMLREFGLELPDDIEVRVWDSTAELRYLVLPERPAGTENMSEEQLAALVTRDAMVGVAKVTLPQAGGKRMNGVHDMGGQHGMGPVQYEKDEPVFHATWEGRVYALNRAMRAWRKWSLDTDRHALEIMPPADYLRMSYYERWLNRLETQRREIRLHHAGRAAEREPGSWVEPADSRAYSGDVGTLAEPRNPVEPGSKGAAIVQGRPARSRAQHQSDRPYSPAPIRARQGGSRVPRPRRLCVPGHQRAFSGRETAARVFRSVHGTRAVGRKRFGARLGAPRHVGRLP